MTKDEMRFLRRELISDYLLCINTIAYSIRYLKFFTRQAELQYYGQELQAYK
jgi:hypothetical protein